MSSSGLCRETESNLAVMSGQHRGGREEINFAWPTICLKCASRRRPLCGPWCPRRARACPMVRVSAGIMLGHDGLGVTVDDVLGT